MKDYCSSCGHEIEEKILCQFTNCYEYASYDIKIELWHVEYLQNKKLCKKHAGIISAVIESLTK